MGGEYLAFKDINRLKEYYSTSLEMITLVLYSDHEVDELPQFLEFLDLILKHPSKIIHREHTLYYVFGDLHHETHSKVSRVNRRS